MQKERMVIDGDLCHNKIINKTTPKLTYNESVNFEEWKKELKAKFVELIGLDLIQANACELNMTIEEDVVMDRYRRIRFVFESEVGSFVPCYLLIPDTGKAKYPVAITLQGHSSGFHNSIGVSIYDDDEEYISTRGDFAVQAVKEGYAALCIEQRCMGERVTSLHTFAKHMCYYPGNVALLLGRTTVGERVWDTQRAIDLLGNFDMLDTDKIILTGNSGGGTTTFYTACLDERIKIAAPSCAYCSYERSILAKRHCVCNIIPGVFRWFEMYDLSCFIAPRHFIAIAGIDDAIFQIEGVKKAMEYTQKFYDLAGASENCELVVTPKGHYWCKDLVWPAIRRHAEKLGWF